MATSDELVRPPAPLPPSSAEPTERPIDNLPADPLLLDSSLHTPSGSPSPARIEIAPQQVAPSGATGQRLQGIVLVLLAILAFLLASSVARNSDVWMHLAQGKWLAQGEFLRGMDRQPESGLPANTSWLCDLIGYGLYSLLGGMGLVLGKAVLVVVLALLIWRLGQPDREWWVAAFCTVVALLAISVRLLLQPATVSYLFLAVALWSVWKRSATSPQPAVHAARSPFPWLLLALFIVWANVDAWFVLGLAIMALIWLGEVLDAVHDAAQPSGTGLALLVRRGLWLVLLTAACLLNPRHLYAVALPAELQSLTQDGASAASAAIEQATSPFERDYLANRGLTPAGLAFFLLLALSLLSFIINYSRWSWQRFLPWVALALLSILQVRTIPFFAVVAGPVLACNVQDCLDRLRRGTPLRRRGLALGRALTWMLLGILPVLAWPGWLQSPPFEPRRWAIETHPALAHGAAAVRAWIREGKCDSQAKGLHLSPESIYAFAWFCPEAKGQRDPELSLALRGDRAADAITTARLRAAGIDHVVVYDTDRSRFLATVGNFFNHPRQWSLLHMEGYLAIFGWRDPSRPASDPFQDRRLDPNRLAFHPMPEQRAPQKSPEREPEVRLWWEAFWKPVPPRTVDQEEATLHLLQADIGARSAPQRHLERWESLQYLALLGAASGWRGPTALVEARQRLALLQPLSPSQGLTPDTIPAVDQVAHGLRMQFFRACDDTSPAQLYLTVRAARRALAVNPDAAQAYLVLGQAYLRLLHNTRERVWGERWIDLLQLRRCQACTALTQALLLKPNFANAHQGLYQLYGEMGYFDLALEHLRKYVQLVREAGPEPGESINLFRERIASHEEELTQLTREVERRESHFLVTAARWKVGDRARTAWQDGLAGRALDLLLDSDISAFGEDGMFLELELLLRTGQAKKVLDLPGPKQQVAMGVYYRLLRIQALAALGDYALAREACNELCGSLAEPTPAPESLPLRAIMAGAIGQRVLNEQAEPKSAGDLLFRTRQRYLFRQRLTELASALSKEADMATLRGLLTLEQGDADEAEIAFRQALSVWKDQASVEAGGGLDFTARRLAQGYLQWLVQPSASDFDRP